MIIVNTHEAKSRLSELIELVITGKEQVVICRNGKPLIDLVAHAEETDFRRDLIPEDRRLKLKGDLTAPLDNEAWPEEFR
ncbi:MAG: Antitoxin Phd YefM, type toxin-antitoxin system [Verrucomicrobiota bacterium]|jgi:prevent-host-death family protein